jgi:DNA (cytosine-5)-methyltransferase 1
MLRVFEAFASYSSQRMTLRNILIPHGLVGISEIEGDVLLSYASIHENLIEERKNIL